MKITAEMILEAFQKADGEVHPLFSGYAEMDDLGMNAVIIDGRWDLERISQILNERISNP